MELYIGHLNKGTTTSHLRGFFRGITHDARYDLIDTTSLDGDLSYCHAVLSERMAYKAIKKLNNKPLNGSVVEVREYYHRTGNNDRRILNWRERVWPHAERRQYDRRKRRMIKPHLAPSFAGHELLSTKQI